MNPLLTLKPADLRHYDMAATVPRSTPSARRLFARLLLVAGILPFAVLTPLLASAAVVQTVTREYDPLSRLKKESYADGRWIEYEYDANGNRKLMRESLPGNTTRVTRYDYDALNRLQQITDADGKITRFAYDARDNQVTVTDPRNLITRYTYNGFNDLIKQVSPDTGTRTWNTAPFAGQVNEEFDARGRRIGYAYDPSGRLLIRTEKNGSVLTQQTEYGWDSAVNGVGQLAAVALKRGSTYTAAENYGYTSLGLLNRKAQQVVINGASDSRTVNYGFDSAGRLSAIAYPSGAQVDYRYDSQGRVTSVRLNGLEFINNISWQAFGGIKGWTWANGLVHTRSYDSSGRPTGYAHGTLLQKTVGWDIGNRIRTITDPLPARNQSYDYDLLDRLKRSTRGTAVDLYGYDADGNRTNNSWGSANFSYSYPVSSNRLSTRNGPDAASSNSYSYDPAGNMISDGKKNYGYSDGGRLLSVQTLAGVTQHSYYYNANGQRVAKKGGSVNRRFVYGENGQLLGEYDVAGFYQEHIWLDGEPVGLIRPPISVGGPRQSFYVLTDHLGTPRAVVDPQRSSASKGLIVWRWDGEAFGADLANPDADGDGAPLTYNLRFPGQYFDVETGRHYNYFRDYDPALGRYVQSDPIGLAGGINTYGYVEANPISSADPEGLWPILMPGRGQAAIQLPKTIKKIFPCLNDTEVTQLAADAIEELNWEDVKAVKAVTPNITTVSPPSNYNQLTPAQQKLLTDFLRRLPPSSQPAAKKCPCKE